MAHDESSTHGADAASAASASPRIDIPLTITGSETVGRFTNSAQFAVPVKNWQRVDRRLIMRTPKPQPMAGEFGARSVVVIPPDAS